MVGAEGAEVAHWRKSPTDPILPSFDLPLPPFCSCFASYLSKRFAITIVITVSLNDTLAAERCLKMEGARTVWGNTILIIMIINVYLYRSVSIRGAKEALSKQEVGVLQPVHPLLPHTAPPWRQSSSRMQGRD